jgi:hypothetical protein
VAAPRLRRPLLPRRLHRLLLPPHRAQHRLRPRSRPARRRRSFRSRSPAAPPTARA